MRALPCDVLITSHPGQSAGDRKAAALAAGTTPNPFIDPKACRALADEYEALFDKRLADEKAGRAS
jgi:metallo-beta-lactamase class B